MKGTSTSGKFVNIVTGTGKVQVGTGRYLGTVPYRYMVPKKSTYLTLCSVRISMTLMLMCAPRLSAMRTLVSSLQKL